MNHEKIIVRENGDKVKIKINSYTVGLSYNENIIYGVDVEILPKGKKKWLDTYGGNDFEYRRLDMTQRAAYQMSKFLKHATHDEIQAAKMELWEKLKPI